VPDLPRSSVHPIGPSDCIQRLYVSAFISLPRSMIRTRDSSAIHSLLLQDFLHEVTVHSLLLYNCCCNKMGPRIDHTPTLACTYAHSTEEELSILLRLVASFCTHTLDVYKCARHQGMLHWRLGARATGSRSSRLVRTSSRSSHCALLCMRSSRATSFSPSCRLGKSDEIRRYHHHYCN
jgi:hypothetical protein